MKGKLCFEGEYMDGKNWNGKKYEYKNREILKFTGELLNGKRNGRGIEYNWNSDEIVFEGEYLNGERWNGKGKEYNEDDQLIFEGEYLEGKKIEIKK